MNRVEMIWRLNRTFIQVLLERERADVLWLELLSDIYKYGQ